MRVILSFTLLLSGLFVGMSYASDDGDNSATRYYRYSDKPGWYWYKDPPAPDAVAPETKSPETAKPKVVEEAKPKRRIPKLSDYTMQQLWDMHPDDFKDLHDDFQKKAVMTLSEQDTKEYLQIKDIARRKAAAHASVASLINQKTPSLSLEKDYSTSTPGRLAMAGVENTERDKRINRSSEQYALIYFFRNDCQFCNAQSEVVRGFGVRHKWIVQPVNLSESPQLGERFNVSIVPSMILIKKGVDDFLPVATGMVTLDRIEARVFSGIRLLNGEIKPEQYFMGDFERGGGFDPLAPLSGK